MPDFSYTALASTGVKSNGVISAASDRATRSFLQRLNERHAERFPGDSELAEQLQPERQIGRPLAYSLVSVPACQSHQLASISRGV